MSRWRPMTPARNRPAANPDSSDLSGIRTGLLSELLSSPAARYKPTQDVVCKSQPRPQHLVVDPRGFEPLTF